MSLNLTASSLLENVQLVNVGGDKALALVEKCHYYKSNKRCMTLRTQKSGGSQIKSLGLRYFKILPLSQCNDSLHLITFFDNTGF